MEQFVLVPISVYNSNIRKPTVVTNKKLPTYQSEEKSTYQVESVKKDFNKNFFAKADSPVDKVLSSPRIKFSTSNFLILDGRDTDVSLTDFAQTLKRKNAEVPDNFFTLPDVADITASLVLNKNAEEKERGSWFLSRSEKQKLQKLYSEGSAAYGSVKNLTKASKFPVSKVQYFLFSKSSYTKFNQATRKFRRMRGFASFRNEFWCMNLAFGDKLAKDNNGVKYLLVRQDMYDRAVDAKGVRTKDSKETVKIFSKMITKGINQKNLIDQGTDFAGDSKKFCVAEGIHVYSTMSETKTTFGERTFRSLKNILYRYMDEHGYKYIHKLSQFVKIMNSRKTRTIIMVPNKVKNSDFMSILYGQHIREFTPTIFAIGENVRISKIDLPFRRVCKPQFTEKNFETVALASRKPPLRHTQ